MRIFVAGATGVLGQQIVPLLVAAGHTVAGMTRSQAKVESLRKLGAEPAVCDVFDADALQQAIITFKPDVILNELTDLPDRLDDLAEHAKLNAKMRRDGTRNLLAAADAAQTPKVIAQSVAWDMKGEGAKAVAFLEHEVLSRDGVIVRYGQLYGPGTFYERDKPLEPRIFLADAAQRTVELLDAPCSIVHLIER